MSLKQSVVIVNEYTVKDKAGKGSRGSTPGGYVERYMARKGATENMTPVRLEDSDSYILRYMARQEAVETLDTIPEIKQEMRRADGYGGIAFGYGDVSLSHHKLRQCSADIQKQFDAGKTVLKTVLSFDEAYLREHGLISPDFEFSKRGDYRGELDQMKLRMAIMNGLDRMGRQYDDLQYVGVIQVDTAHIHCHLAMVDRGRGMVMPDGTQRGKIDETAKRQLRRGIDMFLDEKQKVAMMSSSVTYDRRNARCFIKRYAHETMAERGFAQFVLAALPEDKRLWRAGTNRKEMQKANGLVRDYVRRVLQEPNSGYKEALRSIDIYAGERRGREGLDAKQYRQLIEDGKERLVEDCMNGVYSILKNIPDSERSVWTPMLSTMAMSYDTMSAKQEEDPMIEFGFRLRSYSGRLQHHRKERDKYHELVKAYEATPDASEDARPLADFIRFEEEYNAKLMCKYQHFLSFLPPKKEYEDDFHRLVGYRRRLEKMSAMRDDKDMARMQSDNAEDYGERVYGLKGGQYMVIDPEVLAMRQMAMERRYEEMEEEFNYKLSNYGMTMDEKGVSTKKPYEFHEVKALDIHHLGYDWVRDIPISKINVDEFIEVTDERVRLLKGAVDYLERSGQSAEVVGLPVADIALMQETADSLRIAPHLSVQKPVDGGKPKTKTVRLDADYNRNLRMAIEATVQEASRGFE